MGDIELLFGELPPALALSVSLIFMTGRLSILIFVWDGRVSAVPRPAGGRGMGPTDASPMPISLRR
jgi:hypothetical protein